MRVTKGHARSLDWTCIYIYIYILLGTPLQYLVRTKIFAESTSFQCKGGVDPVVVLCFGDRTFHSSKRA